MLLTEAVTATGLGRELSAALAWWRKPAAVHDPAKVVTDLAVTLALGGGCLVDVALLRAERGVCGRVASDPTARGRSRRWAVNAPAVLEAIDTARAAARARAWAVAGAQPRTTRPARPLVIDLDATLVTSHSDKEHARPTFKRGYGFHPLTALVDRGPAGTGEPLVMLPRATPGRTPQSTTSPSSGRR